MWDLYRDNTLDREESITIDAWKLEAKAMILLVRQEVKNREIQQMMEEFIKEAMTRVSAD